MKTIYVVRHCKATGQSAESPLTETGFKQAEELAEFFSEININRMIASPFLRAIQSVKQLSDQKNITIEVEERLSERVLSTMDLPDWFEKLRRSFSEMELKFDGGESSQEAMDRIVEVVEESIKSDVENTIIVTHGNIMALLLKNYQSDFDFECWRNLSNPDVYRLDFTENEVELERLWSE